MSGRDRNRMDGGSTVTLGAGDSLVGTLRTAGDVTILGTVEGEIHAAGDVTVESDATVQASIEGCNVTIRGTVSGNVTTSRRLQLSGKGTLQGDVHVGRLVVEDGASLNGSISMGTSDLSSWVDTEEVAPVETYTEAMGEKATEAFVG